MLLELFATLLLSGDAIDSRNIMCDPIVLIQKMRTQQSGPLTVQLYDARLKRDVYTIAFDDGCRVISNVSYSPKRSTLYLFGFIGQRTRYYQVKIEKNMPKVWHVGKVGSSKFEPEATTPIENGFVSSNAEGVITKFDNNLKPLEEQRYANVDADHGLAGLALLSVDPAGSSYVTFLNGAWFGPNYHAPDSYSVGWFGSRPYIRKANITGVALPGFAPKAGAWSVLEASGQLVEISRNRKNTPLRRSLFKVPFALEQEPLWCYDSDQLTMYAMSRRGEIISIKKSLSRGYRVNRTHPISIYVQSLSTIEGTQWLAFAFSKQVPAGFEVQWYRKQPDGSLKLAYQKFWQHGSVGCAVNSCLVNSSGKLQ